MNRERNDPKTEIRVPPKSSLEPANLDSLSFSVVPFVNPQLVASDHKIYEPIYPAVRVENEFQWGKQGGNSGFLLWISSRPSSSKVLRRSCADLALKGQKEEEHENRIHWYRPNGETDGS